MSEFAKRILTFLLSMTPIIENRGSVPFGIYQGLSVTEVVILSALGNILIIPVIILTFNKLLMGLKKIRFTRPLAEFLEKRATNKSRKIENCSNCEAYDAENSEKSEPFTLGKENSGKKGQFIGLLLFAAIPVPFTGVWTAAMAAVLLNIKLKKAFLPIAIGTLISIAIVTSVVVLGIEVFSFIAKEV